MSRQLARIVARKASVRPQVERRTRLATRVGACSATRWAIAPPIDAPMTWKRSTPTASMTASALSAGPRPQVNRAALRVPRTSRTTPAMHEKFTRMTPALYDYLVAHAPPPDAVLQDLAAETAALGPISRMQVAVEEAAFLG